MNETIREHIRRRVRWMSAIYVVGFALLFAPMVFVLATGRFNEYRELSNRTKIAGVLVIVLGAALMTRIKCPKCDKPLGAVGMSLIGRRRNLVNFCPNCGLSLDEPMPQKVNPIS
jgi:cytochrome c biogenesis protein CcdA